MNFLSILLFSIFAFESFAMEAFQEKHCEDFSSSIDLTKLPEDEVDGQKYSSSSTEEIPSLFGFGSSDSSGDESCSAMEEFLDLFGFEPADQTGELESQDNNPSRNIPAKFCPSHFKPTQSTLEEQEQQLQQVKKRIESKDITILSVNSGYGKLYKSADRIVKLCSTTGEARMIAELQHHKFQHMPIIFSLTIFSENKKVDNFVTRALLEMSRGNQTLKEYFKNTSIQEKLLIFLGVCTAVQDLHKLGFVHGDLKPDNVLVHDENVLLIDFDQTQEIGNIIGQGTPYYGNKYLLEDGSAKPVFDIFSLGLILYELFYDKIFFAHTPLTDIELEQLKVTMAQEPEACIQIIKLRLSHEIPLLANQIIEEVLAQRLNLEGLMDRVKKLMNSSGPSNA